MDIKAHNLVLFTGAGFTKNFGGFLGSEMWSLVYNHPLVAKLPKLRQLLIQNFDFESVYSEIIESDSSTKEEKEAIRIAVESAYKMLDNATRDWVFNTDSPYPIDWYGLNRLISLFNGNNGINGYFFTLNQDLFMDRHNGYRCPGVSPFDLQGLSGREFTDNHFVTLPSGTDIEKKVEQGIQNHNGLTYIKLHGSYGWRSSSGTNPMVIGANKTKLIENEPILKVYLEIFKKILNSNNKRLLIIGYGFRDRHINEIIWDAAKNYGLKILIISPTPPDKFDAGNFVLDSHRLWDSIIGYFPYHLKEIFPSNQQETVQYRAIKDGLLRD